LVSQSLPSASSMIAQVLILKLAVVVECQMKDYKASCWGVDLADYHGFSGEFDSDLTLQVSNPATHFQRMDYFTPTPMTCDFSNVPDGEFSLPYVWYIDLHPNFKFSVSQMSNNFDSVTFLTWTSIGSLHGLGGCAHFTDWKCQDDPDTRVLEYSNHRGEIDRVYFVLASRLNTHVQNPFHAEIAFHVQEDIPDHVAETVQGSLQAVALIAVAIAGCCCFGIICFCYFVYRSTITVKEKLLMDDDADLQSDITLPPRAKAPSYWVNQDLFGEEFDDFYQVDEQLVPAVQQMFNLTWKDIVTRDRKGGKKTRVARGLFRDALRGSADVFQLLCRKRENPPAEKKY